jgi:hypothetical protein
MPFSRTPTAYARLAANPPTNNVSSPDRSHDVVDQKLLSEPIRKNVIPVRMAEI